MADESVDRLEVIPAVEPVHTEDAGDWCGSENEGSGGLGTYLDARFEVLGKIGEGGMGRVLLGVDRALRRMVALKELRPELGARSDAIERFRREAQIVAQLEHPSIAPVYAAEQRRDGPPAYSMKYIRGRPSKPTSTAASEPVADAKTRTSITPSRRGWTCSRGSARRWPTPVPRDADGRPVHPPGRGAASTSASGVEALRGGRSDGGEDRRHVGRDGRWDRHAGRTKLLRGRRTLGGPSRPSTVDEAISFDPHGRSCETDGRG